MSNQLRDTLGGMKLETKFNIWGLATLAGFFALMIPAVETGSKLLLAAGLLWFLVLGTLQFRWFRCPNCGKVAFQTRRGLYVPSVGTKCRHCTAPY